MKTTNFFIILIAVFGSFLIQSCLKENPIDLSDDNKTLLYKGRTHQAIGSTTLRKDGEKLTVSGISEEDGLRILCPEDQYLDMYFTANEIPEGGYFEGMVFDQNTQEPIAGMALYHEANGEGSVYGYLKDQEAYLVEGYLNGKLVYHEVMPPGEKKGRFRRFLKKVIDFITPDSFHPIINPFTGEYGVSIDWNAGTANGGDGNSNPVDVIFEGANERVKVDEIKIISINPGKFDGGFYAELKGKDMKEMVVLEEIYNQPRAKAPWHIRLGFVPTFGGCTPGMGFCTARPTPIDDFPFDFNELPVTDNFFDEKGNLNINLDGREMNEEMLQIINTSDVFTVGPDTELPLSFIKAAQENTIVDFYETKVKLLEGEYKVVPIYNAQGIRIWIGIEIDWTDKRGNARKVKIGIGFGG